MMDSISIPWTSYIKDGDEVGVTVEVTKGPPISFYQRTNIRIEGSSYFYTFSTEGLEEGWSFTVSWIGLHT